MDYLLDTHAYIWYVEDDKQLSIKARKIIDSSKNNLFFSFASIWEITIKASINKLNLKQNIGEIFKELKLLNINLINFSQNDFETLYKLEYLHHDPFDRLIISQAISNNLTIITRDKLFKKYNVKKIW